MHACMPLFCWTQKYRLCSLSKTVTAATFKYSKFHFLLILFVCFFHTYFSNIMAHRARLGSWGSRVLNNHYCHTKLKKSFEFKITNKPQLTHPRSIAQFNRGAEATKQATGRANRRPGSVRMNCCVDLCVGVNDGRFDNHCHRAEGGKFLEPFRLGYRLVQQNQKGFHFGCVCQIRTVR